MVNKNKVGNIQFLFGIVILILVIISSIYLNSYVRKFSEKTQRSLSSEMKSIQDELNKNNVSNEWRMIIYVNYMNKVESIQRDYMQSLQIIVFILIILLSISILFITQGLANKADYEKGGKK